MIIGLEYRIFGFGHSGSEILAQLMKDNIPKERLFYFDTDNDDIKHHPSSTRYSLAKEVVGENGLNGNVDLGQQAYQHESDLFERLTTDNCLYIIVGGLGGGTFSGTGLALAASLANRGKRIIIVTSLPAGHEKKERKSIAIRQLEYINDFTDKVILLSKSHNKSAFAKSKAEGYRQIDKQASQVIRELLTNTGNLIIESTAPVEDHMFSAIEIAVAYVHNSEVFLGHQDTKLIVASTHDALLKAIDVRPEIAFNISPRMFEELIAHIYGRAGYDTELTKQSRDHGVDIKAWTIAPLRQERFLTILQAKQKQKNSGPVSEVAIRDLIGSRQMAKADRAGLVTTTDFSKSAIVAAKEQKIDLIKFYELLDESKALRNTRINAGSNVLDEQSGPI